MAKKREEYSLDEIDISDDESIYQAAYAKAPNSVKVYIWIDKNLTNPLLLQSRDILLKSL